MTDNIIEFPINPLSKDDEYDQLLNALSRQEAFNAMTAALNAYLRHTGVLGKDFHDFMLDSMRGKLRRLEREKPAKTEG